MSILPPNLTIKTSSDTIGVALALADEYAYLHAGLLLDPNGRVASIRLHTLQANDSSDPFGRSDSETGFDQILKWLVRQPHTWPSDSSYPREAEHETSTKRGSVLLVLVRATLLSAATDAERRLFVKAQHASELSGYALVDVIETDGDCVRSFAHLFDPAST